VNALSKRLLTLGCLVPLPALTALLLLALYGGFEGDPNGAVQNILFSLYWALVAVAVVTWGWTLIVIKRSPLLSDDDRSRWLLLIFLGTVFAVPLAWWRVVRRTPTT
jgi:hypothetical protein